MEDITLPVKEFGQLEEVTNLAEEAMLNLKIPDNAVSLTMVSLAASVVQHVASCVLLMKEGRHTSVPTILRSVMEATVHFQNLVNDPDYLDTLKAAEARQTLKLIQSVRKSISPDTHPEHTKKLDKREARMNELLENTDSSYHCYINAEKAYELATDSNQDTGNPLYANFQLLCRETHNNLSVLSNRHLRGDLVHLLPTPTRQEMHQRIEGCAASLIVVLGQFFTSLEIEDERVERAKKIFDEMMPT